MKKGNGVVAVLALLASPAAGPDKNFAAVHHRANKNANVVALRRPAHRGRQTGSQGAGDRLLILLAEDGRRKELSWIEKKMAYGFTIKPDRSGKRL